MAVDRIFDQNSGLSAVNDRAFCLSIWCFDESIKVDAINEWLDGTGRKKKSVLGNIFTGSVCYKAQIDCNQFFSDAYKGSVRYPQAGIQVSHRKMFIGDYRLMEAILHVKSLLPPHTLVSGTSRRLESGNLSPMSRHSIMKTTPS